MRKEREWKGGTSVRSSSWRGKREVDLMALKQEQKW